MRAIVIGVLVCCGCAGAEGALIGAVVNTSIAVAASGASRAGGGCYTPCTPGTTCNAKTGFCDVLPCHGRCRADELCADEGTFTEHCASGRVVAMPGS